MKVLYEIDKILSNFDELKDYLKIRYMEFKETLVEGKTSRKILYCLRK